jgi:hypothetical protein
MLAPLFEILARHHAAPNCQFDAFAEYVAAADEHGVESYPLYHWTKEAFDWQILTSTVESTARLCHECECLERRPNLLIQGCSIATPEPRQRPMNFPAKGGQV